MDVLFLFFQQYEVDNRVMSLFTISISFPEDQKLVVKYVKDSRMKISDKISWIGGNLGLFTGWTCIVPVQGGGD